MRCGELARSDAVPDEPARRGPDDGRAVGNHAETITRAAHPGGEAQLIKTPAELRGDGRSLQRSFSKVVRNMSLRASGAGRLSIARAADRWHDRGRAPRNPSPNR